MVFLQRQVHLVPVLRLIRYAQLQQDQLLVLANALSDAVVHTLTSGRGIFEFNIVVTASGPNHGKPAAPFAWSKRSCHTATLFEFGLYVLLVFSTL